MEVHGEWFYYIGDLDDSVNKFYRLKTDGSYKEKLIDEDVDNFIISDDKIYCIIFEDAEDKELGGKIYRMNLDGDSKTRLSEFRALYFNVFKDKIVFNNEKEYSGFYIMDCDGYNIIKVEEDSFDIRIKGSEVYYISFSEGSQLIKYNFDAKERLVLDQRECELCDLENGWIYYIYKASYSDESGESNDVLYRIKEDGTQSQKLYEGMIFDLNIADSWIFFVDCTKTKECLVYGGNIYKLKCDGSEIKTINNSKSYNLYIENDGYIFYEKKAYLNKFIYRGIYKVKTDGTGYKKLTNGSCRIVDIKDDWIYYRVLGKQTSTKIYEVLLRRIKKDGTNDMFLLKFEEDIKSIMSGHV